MESHTKISIIVPVYNVEPYIERCLRSLIDQDIPEEDYEIIVVNDGSSDNSREIVVRIQSDFKNLILIDQENKGVSVARNNGLKRAKGNFVLFIDSDDYIYMNTLRQVIEQITKEDLDVLYLSQTTVDSNNNICDHVNFGEYNMNLFSGPQTYLITRKHLKIGDSSVALILKKSFLEENEINYPVDVPFLEDGVFGGKVLLTANRCSFNSTKFYYRTMRLGSATNSNLFFKKESQLGFIKGVIDFQKFAQKYNKNNEQLSLANHVIAKFVITAVISAIGSKNVRLLKAIKKDLKNNGFQKINKTGIYTNQSYAFYYNRSFWLFVVYYIIETRLKVLKNLITPNK